MSTSRQTDFIDPARQAGMTADSASDGLARMQIPPVYAALHLLLDLEAQGEARDYGRSMLLDRGEIVVRWTDDVGRWERRVFASRPDNVLAILTRQLDRKPFDCRVRAVQAPGSRPGDISSLTIQHVDQEIYLHAAYGKKLGKPEPAGFHSLSRA